MLSPRLPIPKIYNKFLGESSYKNQSVVVDPENRKKSIEKFLEIVSYPSKSIISEVEAYYWKPPANKNRVVAQYSCFIFTANEPINEELYREISIRGRDKEKILSLLEKYYSLDYKSIFRDFTGFASSHGLHKPIKAVTSRRLLSAAIEYCQQGKYQEVINYCTKAIKIDSNYDTAYFIRGLNKCELNKYEAIEDVTETIRLNQNHELYFYLRGAINIELNQYQEAIEDYTQAIIIKADFAEAYLKRGSAKVSLKQYEEAIEDCTQAITIEPDVAASYQMRGLAKMGLEQYEEAIEDFTQAITIKPDDAKGHLEKRQGKGSRRKSYYRDRRVERAWNAHVPHRAAASTSSDTGQSLDHPPRRTTALWLRQRPGRSCSNYHPAI